MLRSALLRSSQRLNDCEVRDAAHVILGDRGPHVGLIQQALIKIFNAQFLPNEISQSLYGSSTAKEVLRYKSDRKIINRHRQTKPDDVVGMMTIKSIDDELFTLEQATDYPFSACAARPLKGRLPCG